MVNVKNIILHVFTDLRLLMFHYNIVKISEILNKWNILKTFIETTYHIEFCICGATFTMEESKTIR